MQRKNDFVHSLVLRSRTIAPVQTARYCMVPMVVAAVGVGLLDRSR